MPNLMLRATDQETARVVAVLDKQGRYVGAGCLADATAILTCCHVVQAVLGERVRVGARLEVQLVGVKAKPIRSAVIKKLGTFLRDGKSLNDLALLALDEPLSIQPAEFATPLRHSRKSYSVLGFPDGEKQGRNASGLLHAADADGLVQMDGNSALFVRGGFSGAPVWSPELRAFVGMVVTERYDAGVAWCIPSRVLCQFYESLHVRFRIPPGDRPVVNDYDIDDPNVDLFGTSSEDNGRRLSVKVKEKEGWYEVKATYKVLKGRPRGRYVTFITFPDFKSKKEDAYEMFRLLDENGEAEADLYPADLFTIAAIGDAGDTALTIHLDRKQRK